MSDSKHSDSLSRRHFVAGTASLLAAGAVQAQSAAPAPGRYPDRPIRLVVPFAPGGDGDVMARYWAKHAAAISGWNIVIENKAGAGGDIGATEVARARADGYTLLLGTTTTQIVNPLASSKQAYDPIKDFALVGMVSVNPTSVIVNPSVPANSLRELVALARANPGKYSYGSAGQGTITNLTGELLKHTAGKLEIQHVPYRGGGPAMSDLIAGHVPIITPIMSSAVLSQHRAGKARILAVNSANRLKVAPDIPTAAEAGLPEMRVMVFNAIFAPAGVPKPAMDALKALAQRVMAEPGFVQDVEKAGAEIFNVADPEKYIADEVARWRPVIQATGFKAD